MTSNYKSEVYNQEIKDMFIDWIDIEKYPPRWWERVFEKTKILEEKYGKDLFNFTTEQIIEFYKFLDINSLESLMIYNINLIKYGNWALGQHLIIDGQNHFSEISNENLAACVNASDLNKSILDYKDLRQLMGQLYNDQDRFIFFCLFEGIKGKDYCEILNLKMSDIDGNKVKLINRTIMVNENFAAVAKEADREMEYITLTQRPIKLIPSITIYKEKYNSQGIDPGRTIYSTLIRGIQMAGISSSVNASSIYNSGLIYYLNQLATKEEVTVETLLEDFDYREKVKPILNKYKFNINMKKRFMLKYKEYLV